MFLNPNTSVVDDAGASLAIGPALTGRPLYADPPAAQLGGVMGNSGLDRVCAPFDLPFGWVPGRDFDFIIQYTPTRFRVFVDFVEVFDYRVIEAGELQLPKEGRISPMNNSQGYGTVLQVAT